MGRRILKLSLIHFRSLGFSVVILVQCLSLDNELLESLIRRNVEKLFCFVQIVIEYTLVHKLIHILIDLNYLVLKLMSL